METIEERIQMIKAWIASHAKEDERRNRELEGYKAALSALEGAHPPEHRAQEVHVQIPLNKIPRPPRPRILNYNARTQATAERILIEMGTAQTILEMAKYAQKNNYLYSANGLQGIARLLRSSMTRGKINKFVHDPVTHKFDLRIRAKAQLG